MKSRFIEKLSQYAKIATASDDNSTSKPSTQVQFNLAKILVQELIDLGLDAKMSDTCYVYAELNANKKGSRVCLLAHMDVSPDAPSIGVVPIVHDYKGGDLVLKHVTIPAKDISAKPGATIMTSDGSTLLGSDDKSGIAIIMLFLEEVLKNKNLLASLPSIAICFTPDEEVGRGTENIDLQFLKGDYSRVLGLTIDGGDDHELCFQTFAAYGFEIKVEGYNVHPGYAFGKMVNSILAAGKLIEIISETFKTPAQSKFMDGYVHVNDVSGSVGKSTVSGIIRSFSDTEMQQFVKGLQEVVDAFKKSYSHEVTISFKEQYKNITSFLPPEFVQVLKETGKQFNATDKAIRGGTDGCRLSVLGIPTPDIWTGGANFHSVKEHVIVDEAADCVAFLLQLLPKL